MKQSSSIARLLRETAWAPLTVIVLHEVFAKLFGHEPYVDPAMHFLGGAAAAYVLRRACVRLRCWFGELSPIAQDLMAFGGACVAAVAWEFMEWGSDVFLGSNIQRSGAAPLRDLAIGLAGASVFLVLRRVAAEVARYAGWGDPRAPARDDADRQ